jgi:hypothetical protein
MAGCGGGAGWFCWAVSAGAASAGVDRDELFEAAGATALDEGLVCADQHCVGSGSGEEALRWIQRRRERERVPEWADSVSRTQRPAQNVRDPGFVGIVNPENDAVYLPLKKGNNELMLGVSELGGDRGFNCRLAEMEN